MLTLPEKAGFSKGGKARRNDEPSSRQKSKNCSLDCLPRSSWQDCFVIQKNCPESGSIRVISLSTSNRKASEGPKTASTCGLSPLER